MAGILVAAEHANGKLSDMSREVIAAAVDLKATLGGPLLALVVADDPAAFATALNLAGVDEVLTVTSSVAHFDAALTEAAIAAAAEQRQVRAVLVPNSVGAMAYAAAVAARIGAGFASDVFALDVQDGEIVATRSGYGAKVNMEIEFPGKPVVVLTLRGATWKAADAPGQAKVTSLDIATVAVSTHVGYVEALPSGIDIEKAEFILSIGRGVQDKDNVPRFQALADRIGATLGCSRPVADSGWLPKAHQVGQSGKVAANCKLYIALGISGAVQHLFGMKHIETVIAVNTDLEAPIFNNAKYGANVDLFALADALEKRFN